jgi:hypothetical protein
MRIETITRIKIIADAGMILTNGETYGEEKFLAEGASASDFHEITKAEYENILAEMEKII